MATATIVRVALRFLKRQSSKRLVTFHFRGWWHTDPYNQLVTICLQVESNPHNKKQQVMDFRFRACTEERTKVM